MDEERKEKFRKLVRLLVVTPVDRTILTAALQEQAVEAQLWEAAQSEQPLTVEEQPLTAAGLALRTPQQEAAPRECHPMELRHHVLGMEDKNNAIDTGTEENIHNAIQQTQTGRRKRANLKRANLKRKLPVISSDSGDSVSDSSSSD